VSGGTQDGRLYETTNYGKYEVAGRGARAWLDRVFASRIPKPGRFALAPMLNPAGRIMGDLSIACLADDRFLIVGSGFAEEFHLRWFWASEPAADVWVRSAASSLNGVSIAGPKSRQLVQRLVRDDLSPSRSSCSRSGRRPSASRRPSSRVPGSPVNWATRSGRRPTIFASLYDDLWDAGRELGLVHFGGRALSSLRLEKA